MTKEIEINIGDIVEVAVKEMNPDKKTSNRRWARVLHIAITGHIEIEPLLCDDDTSDLAELLAEGHGSSIVTIRNHQVVAGHVSLPKDNTSVKERKNAYLHVVREDKIKEVKKAGMKFPKEVRKYLPRKIPAWSRCYNEEYKTNKPATSYSYAHYLPNISREERRMIDDTYYAAEAHNKLQERLRKADAIKVGDGMTYKIYTDADPYTVISRSAKTLVLQADKTEFNKEKSNLQFSPGGFAGHTSGHQEWDISPDTNGSIIKATLRQNGCWKLSGVSTRTRGMDVFYGRHKHYDYNY